MSDEKTNLDAPGCFYCLNVRPFFRKAWSEATRDHFRNARVEVLKGFRSLIDDRINDLARHEVKGTHVAVE